LVFPVVVIPAALRRAMMRESVVGYAVGHDGGAPSGAHSGGVVGVLVGHRHPVQRPEALTVGQSFVGSGGADIGRLVIAGDHSIDRGIDLIDAVEMIVQRLAGRDLLRSDPGSELSGGQPAQFLAHRVTARPC
jgi:hypothetical protein